MYTSRVLARRLDRAGFGLPATIMMLIIFAVMGLVGISLARQEARSQVRATSRDQAFYAAEAGLARGLANWTVPDTLVPGGTYWLLDSGTLPGGAGYRVGAIRLGDGSSIHSIFAIHSEGTGRDGSKQTAGLLVHTLPLENPFKGALEVKDSTILAGTSNIVGLDNIPPTWTGAYCTALDQDMAGVVMADTTLYERSGAAKVKGAPPLAEEPDTVGFFNLGDITYDELVADANINLPGGTTMSGSYPQPSYNADGTCNTSDPNNWGDPLTPGQPCSNWFPTIHVAGDLHLEATQAGQGLLLVDGDLTAKGGFLFFGPVLVKGELIAEGGFTFFGGVKATKTELGAGNAEIYYSACVLQRVLSSSRAARPRLLSDRPWYRNR